MYELMRLPAWLGLCDGMQVVKAKIFAGYNVLQGQPCILAEIARWQYQYQIFYKKHIIL
jgi:hypothetical protein